jgi:mono/diheme cytochrome c family protein
MKDHLDDQEIADLLSYIRNSFGNSADRITPDEVARARE